MSLGVLSFVIKFLLYKCWFLAFNWGRYTELDAIGKGLLLESLLDLGYNFMLNKFFFSLLNFLSFWFLGGSTPFVPFVYHLDSKALDRNRKAQPGFFSRWWGARTLCLLARLYISLTRCRGKLWWTLVAHLQCDDRSLLVCQPLLVE